MESLTTGPELENAPWGWTRMNPPRQAQTSPSGIHIGKLRAMPKAATLAAAEQWHQLLTVRLTGRLLHIAQRSRQRHHEFAATSLHLRHRLQYRHTLIAGGDRFDGAGRLDAIAVGLRSAAEAFDEICWGYAKPLGKLDHTPGADPVGPFFVLLHLLKRDPRRRAELATRLLPVLRRLAGAHRLF